MGSIDKDEEYAAAMLATRGMPDGKHEIEDGPPMTSGGPCWLRSCGAKVWWLLKSQDIRTGRRVRIRPGPTDPQRTIFLSGVCFHLSWVRAIEAEHGPLLWALSSLIGEAGAVVYLEYDCGCGQTFPGDPMIGVTLDCGVKQEFWAEELGR